MGQRGWLRAPLIIQGWCSGPPLPPNSSQPGQGERAEVLATLGEEPPCGPWGWGQGEGGKHQCGPLARTAPGFRPPWSSLGNLELEPWDKPESRFEFLLWGRQHLAVSKCPFPECLDIPSAQCCEAGIRNPNPALLLGKPQITAAVGDLAPDHTPGECGQAGLGIRNLVPNPAPEHSWARVLRGRRWAPGPFSFLLLSKIGSSDVFSPCEGVKVVDKVARASVNCELVVGKGEGVILTNFPNGKSRQRELRQGPPPAPACYLILDVGTNSSEPRLPYW